MVRNHKKNNKNKNKKIKNPNPYTSPKVEKKMENIVPENKTKIMSEIVDTLKSLPVGKEETILTKIGEIKDKPQTHGYTYTWSRCNHNQDVVPIANGKVYASGSRATGDNVKDTGMVHIPKQVSIYLDGLTWKAITGIVPDPTNQDAFPLTKGVNYILWPDLSIIPAPKYEKLLNNTIKMLNAGYEVEIGCIGAHGRTGTLIAGLIVLTEGLGAEAAIKATRSRLCTTAIETRSQENMIYALCGEPLLAVPTYMSTPNHYGGTGASYKYQTFNALEDEEYWFSTKNTGSKSTDSLPAFDFENGHTIKIPYYGENIALEDFTEEDFVFNVEQDTFTLMSDLGDMITLEEYDKYLDTIKSQPWWIKELSEVLDLNLDTNNPEPSTKITKETKIRTKDGVVRLDWVIVEDFIWDETLGTNVLITEDNRVVTFDTYKSIVNKPIGEEYLSYRVPDKEFNTQSMLIPNPVTIGMDTQIKAKYGILKLSDIIPTDFTWNGLTQRYEIRSIDNMVITGKEYVLIFGTTIHNKHLELQGTPKKGE